MENFSYRGMEIPHRMMKPLMGYIGNHHPVGSFLQAVISNDLANACGKADDENIKLLPAYVAFLYNYAPSSCWGSAEKYQEWIKGGNNE